jgi:hypothetical protein
VSIKENLLEHLNRDVERVPSLKSKGYVNPDLYAIWDGRVSRYCFGNCWNRQVQGVTRFEICLQSNSCKR